MLQSFSKHTSNILKNNLFTTCCRSNIWMANSNTRFPRGQSRQYDEWQNKHWESRMFLRSKEEYVFTLFRFFSITTNKATYIQNVSNFFFNLYLSYLFWFSVFRKHNIHTVTGRRLYMKLYTSTKACSEKEQEETKAVPSVRLKENMSVCVCAFSLGRKGAIAQKQTTNRDGGKGVWSVLEISLFTETSWQKAFFFSVFL